MGVERTRRMRVLSRPNVRFVEGTRFMDVADENWDYPFTPSNRQLLQLEHNMLVDDSVVITGVETENYVTRTANQIAEMQMQQLYQRHRQSASAPSPMTEEERITVMEEYLNQWSSNLNEESSVPVPVQSMEIVSDGNTTESEELEGIEAARSILNSHSQRSAGRGRPKAQRFFPPGFENVLPNSVRQPLQGKKTDVLPAEDELPSATVKDEDIPSTFRWIHIDII